MRFGATIPDLPDAPGFTSEGLAEARRDSSKRRLLLRRYRWEIVRPALMEVESAHYATQAQRIVPVLDIPFSTLIPLAAPFSLAWLAHAGNRYFWRCFRCWNMIRLTGRWPTAVTGNLDMPFHLPFCVFCAAPNITVRHVLLDCPGTSDALLACLSDAGIATSSGATTMLVAIFGAFNDPTRQAHFIEFVGRCVLPMITAAGDDQESTLSLAGPCLSCLVGQSGLVYVCGRLDGAWMYRWSGWSCVADDAKRNI